MTRRYLVIIETPEWETQKKVKLSLKGTYRHSNWKFIEIRELKEDEMPTTLKPQQRQQRPQK